MRGTKALVATLLIAGILCASAAPLHADQGRQRGRWIVDEAGRVVILHGVNAVWKIAPYYPPDEPKGFAAADAQWLAGNGFNGVRLGVLFAGVMPQEGSIDAGYLDAVDRVVELLAAQKIYVLLDFHQDMYNEKFQGEGFPAWSVYDDGLPHPHNFGFPGNYLTPEVMHTFDNLWLNRNSIWDRYRDAWAAVATKWKTQDYLLGYDLLNEPWPGTDWVTCANPFGCPAHDALKLQPFQEHALEGIRGVDPGNIVWFEPNVIFNSGAKSQLGTVKPIAPSGNLGLSWHDYCLPAGLVHAQGFTDVPTCEQFHQVVFDNAEEAIDRIGSATLVTEFGASDDLPDIEHVIALADEHTTGWLYWHYKEWSDPTTESQDSGGQGLFTKDDDLTTLKQPKADVLIRTYPQAVAGTPMSFSFDPTTKQFTLQYSADPAISAPTEIFVPVARHYAGSYSVSVTGPAGVISGPNAPILKLQNSGSGTVTVTVTRP